MGRLPGPPPTPTEQKRRTGNPGKRPLPVPTAALPPAPRESLEPLRPLAEAGRALWDRTWHISAAWISSDTDVELLQLTCELLDERQFRRAEVLAMLSEGIYCKDQSAALRTIEAAIVSNLQTLGLTPTDRARLGVAEVMAQSTLDKLRERQAQRRAG